MTNADPSTGSRASWILGTVATALAAAALALALVALLRPPAHEHAAAGGPWEQLLPLLLLGAAADAGGDWDIVPEPGWEGGDYPGPGEATEPAPASSGPSTAPLGLAAYLEACAVQDRVREWPASWGAAAADVRDTLNAAWATTPPPELADFHARRLQAMAMVLAFLEAQDHDEPPTEEGAALLAVPARAAAQLLALAAEDLDADLRGRLEASGCWEGPAR